MSGGCERPRRELSVREHAELRQQLVSRGLVEIEAPTWVQTGEDYQDWRFSLRWGCSLEAVKAWRRETVRLDEKLLKTKRDGGNPSAVEEEKRKLFDPKAWSRAFDEAHRQAAD